VFREGILSTLDLARQLLSQGRVAEAERACEQVLEHTPNAVEALNVCAVASLREHRYDRAVELLERAVEVAPDDPVSQHNLGRAYEAAGRVHDAIDALVRAVRLRPVYHVARIRLAALLEARGERDRAVLQYARALEDAQRQGRWLDAAGTPVSLRPLVERGVKTVRTHRAAALGVLVESWRRRTVATPWRASPPGCAST
jgi:tetratricopeptide (TPR) repeat protein